MLEIHSVSVLQKGLWRNGMKKKWTEKYVWVQKLLKFSIPIFHDVFLKYSSV